MKTTLDIRELKYVVDGLTKIVPRKSSLPVLKTVRITRCESGVTLEATDLDQQAKAQIQAYREGDGPFLVDLEQLRALLARAEGKSIVLEAQNDQVHITRQVGGQSVTQACTWIDPKEYPNLSWDGSACPVDASFLELYRRVSPCASRDASRPVLNGVYLDVSESSHYLVATDGRRLTAVNSLRYPVEASCVIPVTRFLTWNKLPGELAMGLNKMGDIPRLTLTAGTWTYQVRTIDGTYPNWRQVLPTQKGRYGVSLSEEDAALLLKALPTMPGHEARQPSITLLAEQGKLVVSAQGENDKQPVNLELSHSTSSGGNTVITVGRDYLADALEAGFTSFSFQGHDSPLRADDGKGGVHVLMPIRRAHTPPDQKPETETTKESTMKTEAPKNEANALDRVVAAYEQAKAKVREANEALAVIALAVKDALKEDKQRRAEIENVRTGLARLQSIKV